MAPQALQFELRRPPLDRPTAARSLPALPPPAARNLPDDIREREIEDLFSKYGKVLSVDMKAPVRPPAFAFIEYGDPR